MIATKVFSCMNFLKVEGDSLISIIPNDNIAAVSCAIDSFDNDIAAISNVKEIVSRLLAGKNHVLEESYNPDFYPSLSADEVLSKRAKEIDKIKENVPEHIDPDSIIVPVTHAFDELGDFVLYRAIGRAETFSVTAKVISDPETYVQEKQLDFMTGMDVLNKQSPALLFH